MDSKRRQQGEIVIEHVRIAHAARNKFVVRSPAKNRAAFDALRSNSFIGARKPAEDCRSIVTRKINAGIKFCFGNLQVFTDVSGVSFDYVAVVHLRDRGKKWCAAPGDYQGDVRIWKLLTNSINSRRR